MAAGASHAYFGHDEWEPLAPGLKTVEDAMEIRNRVLLAFELAERQAAGGDDAHPLNFIVVGAGPTGVELAGTLAEITRTVLAKDFRKIDPKRARIILLEGGKRVLPAYPEDLSASAQRQLQHLGVEVWTSAIVTSIEPRVVHVGGEVLPATVTLWAAGVAASPLGKLLGVPLDRAGRVQVERDLSLPRSTRCLWSAIWLRCTTSTETCCRAWRRSPSKKVRRPRKIFCATFAESSASRSIYFDKGSLATIGRAAAVGQCRQAAFLRLPTAWLAWLFVHITYLIGFRNRFVVLFSWAWSYWTYDRGVRLITGKPELSASTPTRKTRPCWRKLRDKLMTTNSQALAEKVALVTGGGHGIGAAIAAQLAELGANVLICGKVAGPAGCHGEALARRRRTM